MIARSAILALVSLTSAGLTSGCATGSGRGGPVEVIRYNLGTPIGPGSFRLEPLRTGAMISTEYQAQADAVGRALGAIGFRQVSGDDPAAYVVEVAFARQATGERTAPAFSVGLGGGTGGGGFRRGGGVGVGGGVSTGIGGGRSIVSSELSAKLRRRTDSTVVWEGTARTIGPIPAGPPASAAQADRLAAALFRDFPGQSGITTTVP